MKNLKMINRMRFTNNARLILLGIAVISLALVVGRAAAARHAVHIRWDLISLQFTPGPNILPGGIDSAKASDGSEITLTGSGTFLSSPGQGQPQGVTGGGKWFTFAPDGTPTDSGTYSVTGLVSFEVAPGSIPAVIIDHIGANADARAGLVVLTIAYDDGSRGVLTVSCNLPVGTPDPVLEGISATKGNVDFWNAQQPVDGVDANRTAFHILP